MMIDDDGMYALEKTGFFFSSFFLFLPQYREFTIGRGRYIYAQVGIWLGGNFLPRKKYDICR